MNSVNDTTPPAPRLRRLVLAPVAVAALAVGLVACGDDDDGDAADDITIVDGWIREPADGQTRSAAYATITNDGDEEITLVAASTPLDSPIEIHETLMDDEGSMSMQEREGGFAIAAGETFKLEPGGPHVMFMDIDAAELTGTIDVTYIFDNGAEIVVASEVRALQGDEMGDMDHGDMDHDDMEMDDMDHDDHDS